MKKLYNQERGWKMTEELLLVNDIMAKDVITINANRPVSEAIGIMVEKDISGIVVGQ
jgi:CBS domain-containing protein